MLKLLKDFDTHIRNLKPIEVVLYGLILGMILIWIDPLAIIRGF
jgi:hypothetical protein